jgi:trk system potassium uptake protein TrkH
MRRRLSTRRGVQYYVIDGEKVKELDALQRYRGAVALTSLFVGAIGMATLMLLVVLGTDYTPHEVLFEVTSAMSNVGLSTGITGADNPWSAKLVMIVLMWMGRLEITAVLVLIGLPLVLASRAGEKDKAH